MPVECELSNKLTLKFVLIVAFKSKMMQNNLLFILFVKL